ncbi:MAG: four helix bundle protein [Crocinitomicaceae bacterium]
MHNFKNLNVWKRSVDLAVNIIGETKKFPVEYRYDLSSQLNRCGISIPSNIAEGTSRRTKKDFSRFLDIALGSAFEMEAQLVIANRVGILENNKAKELTSEVMEIQKMIVGFKSTIKA